MRPSMITIPVSRRPDASSSAGPRVVIVLALFTLTAASIVARAGTTSFLGGATEQVETGLDGALLAARRLGEEEGRPAVAVNLTPVGHIEFLAPQGIAYTAGTPAELARAAGVLLPGKATDFSEIHAVATTTSLFSGPEAWKQLPKFKSIRVSVGSSVYPLERRPASRLAMRLSPHLALVIMDRPAFIEAMTQLRRPVAANHLAMLSALETSSRAEPAAPRNNVHAKGLPIIPADADRLPDVLASHPRRTLLLVGKLHVQTVNSTRADGTRAEFIQVAPPSGQVRTLPVSDLVAAARENDVDFVILDTDPPRQPGGRTWLYQGISISNADRAAKARTFQDLVLPLAEARGGFDLAFAFDASGSVRLDAMPAAGGLLSDWFGAAAGAADAVAAEVAGSLKPRAVRAYLVPAARQLELQSRLVPFVPSSIQWAYAALAVAGLAGWRTARVWWRRTWPLEKPADYAGRAGWVMARAIRFAFFLALFLPLAGLPAAVTGLLRRIGRRRPRPA